MAMSVNGMIAKSDDDTSWISKEEWDSYSAAVRSVRCLIVGRRTYDILTKQPEFSEFKNVKVVVVSGDEVALVASNHSLAHSPQEALNLLKDFANVVVAGGGILNASFLAENLVDELYVDIEPLILGTGIPIFKNQEFTRNLQFLGSKQITENEIQLHYRVV